MSYYYSASAPGFFSSAMHLERQIPSDAVAISKDLYLSLLQGESSGKVIGIDAKGVPALFDPVVNPEAVATQERAWRDAEISNVQWLRDRHRDEVELSVSTSLSVNQYGDLLEYLQRLRDWPQSADFPDQGRRPIKPDWITQQTQ